MRCRGEAKKEKDDEVKEKQDREIRKENETDRNVKRGKEIIEERGGEGRLSSAQKRTKTERKKDEQRGNKENYIAKEMKIELD